MALYRLPSGPWVDAPPDTIGPLGLPAGTPWVGLMLPDNTDFIVYTKNPVPGLTPLKNNEIAALKRQYVNTGLVDVDKWMTR